MNKKLSVKLFSKNLLTFLDYYLKTLYELKHISRLQNEHYEIHTCCSKGTCHPEWTNVLMKRIRFAQKIDVGYYESIGQYNYIYHICYIEYVLLTLFKWIDAQ